MGVTTKVGEVKKIFLELVILLNSVAAKLLILFVEHLKIVMGNRGKESPSKLMGEGAVMCVSLQFVISLIFNLHSQLSRAIFLG